jgi:hypothetical protein
LTATGGGSVKTPHVPRMRYGASPNEALLIVELALSARVRNALLRQRVVRVDALLEMSDEALLNLSGVGFKGLSEIKSALAAQRNRQRAASASTPSLLSSADVAEAPLKGIVFEQIDIHALRLRPELLRKVRQWGVRRVSHLFVVDGTDLMRLCRLTYRQFQEISDSLELFVRVVPNAPENSHLWQMPPEGPFDQWLLTDEELGTLQSLPAESLEMPLAALELPMESAAVLARCGIESIETLLATSPRDLVCLPGFRLEHALSVHGAFDAFIFRSGGLRPPPRADVSAMPASRPLLSCEQLKAIARSPWELEWISIQNLHLPYRIQRALREEGVGSVSALVGLGETRPAKLDNIRLEADADVRASLDALVRQLMSTQPSMVEYLPRLTERHWLVLSKRRGPLRKSTLAELGSELGISRERARQIEAEAIQTLKRSWQRATPALDWIEKGLSRTRREDAPRSAPAVRDVIRRSLSLAKWEVPNEETVGHLVLMLRALTASGVAELETHWPKLSLCACLLDPPVLENKTVAAWTEEEKRKERDDTRTWTYEELAEAVLRSENRPLHWSQLAEAAEAFGHRGSLSRTGFYNALLLFPEKFVRVDQGTYALAEWGLPEAEPYTDILAEVLWREGKPLSKEQLQARVNSVRPIRESSLVMYLGLHPRFYESSEGTFGLRAWLPPREKQTLRTPKSLVETDASLVRIGRAKSRGYDVDAIVQVDRERILAAPG